MFLYYLGLLGHVLPAQDAMPRYKISLGYGVPNVAQYSAFVKSYESQPGYESKGTGPFHFKFEYRYNRRFGFGLNVNYMGYRIQYLGTAFDPKLGTVPNEITINSNSAAFNIRTNYYFNDPNKQRKKSEFYIGFGIGYNLSDFNVTSQYEEYTPVVIFNDLYQLGLELTGGYRYNFNRYLAVYSEIGYAKSILQFGVTGSF